MRPPTGITLKNVNLYTYTSKSAPLIDPSKELGGRTSLEADVSMRIGTISVVDVGAIKICWIRIVSIEKDSNYPIYAIAWEYDTNTKVKYNAINIYFDNTLTTAMNLEYKDNGINSLEETYIGTNKIEPPVIGNSQIIVTPPVTNQTTEVNDYDLKTFTFKRNDDVSANIISNMLNNAEISVNRDLFGDTIFEYNEKYYNRFKLEYPDYRLAKSNTHIFICKPECNIFNPDGTLLSQFRNNNNWNHLANKDPRNDAILYNLTSINTPYETDFNFLLSNNIIGAEINDKFISSGEYGKSLTGHSIQYGKSNVLSKVGDSVTLTFKDNAKFSIYKYHQFLNDYISGVYRGKYEPSMDSILNKSLDYVVPMYSITTGPDGSEILFWSKHYGLFPLNTNANLFSFGSGDYLKNVTLSINYKFSTLEQYDIFNLVEFNAHSIAARSNGKKYYGKINTLGTGYTWSSTPFVTLENGKLRLRFTTI
jgi:hypothetical protein